MPLFGPLFKTKWPNKAIECFLYFRPSVWHGITGPIRNDLLWLPHYSFFMMEIHSRKKGKCKMSSTTMLLLKVDHATDHYGEIPV